MMCNSTYIIAIDGTVNKSLINYLENNIKHRLFYLVIQITANTFKVEII